jgi:F-type H+-transporting ATPase subunit epsilon
VSITVAIVTPEEEALSLTCDEVIAPGLEGDLGFLPGHIPLVSALRPGVLTVREGNQNRYFAVGPGYVEIDDDKVIVLTEVCERPDQIDPAEEERAIGEAQSALAELGPADPQFMKLTRTVQLAQSRIEAHRRA